MSLEAQVGEAGPKFHFEGLGVTKCLFEVLPPEPHESDEQRPSRLPAELQIGAEIKIDQEKLRAAVTLDVHVNGDSKWQPYKLQVTVIGAFSSKDATVEQLGLFCQLGVPPILFPYVRERINHMTMDGPHGPLRLDPVNISQMLNVSPWAPKTEGQPTS